MDPCLQMKESATRLGEILSSDGAGGRDTASRAEMEAALRNIERLLGSLQGDVEKSTGTASRRKLLLNAEQFDNVSAVGRTGEEAAAAAFCYKHHSHGQQATGPQHSGDREPRPTTTSVTQQERGKGPKSAGGDKSEGGPGQGRPRISCEAAESHDPVR